MGLPWIPIHTNLPGHPKSIALGIALNNRRAWTHMLQLWLWAGDHCETGRLSARNAQALVEHAAGWDGEGGAFFRAALDAGFLDSEPDGSVLLHDWEEHNSAHVEKKERDATRQRERRLRRATKSGRVADESVTARDKSVTGADASVTVRDKVVTSGDKVVTEGGRFATVAGDIDIESKTETDIETESVPTEHVRAPPEKYPAPAVPEKPDTPDGAWGGMDFWAWAQAKRREAGLQAERRPNERTVSVWWSHAQMQGATVKQLRLAFVAFGNDPYWTDRARKPPVPFGGFISQWERFVTPEVNRAAG